MNEASESGFVNIGDLANKPSPDSIDAEAKLVEDISLRQMIDSLDDRTAIIVRGVFGINTGKKYSEEQLYYAGITKENLRKAQLPMTNREITDVEIFVRSLLGGDIMTPKLLQVGLAEAFGTTHQAVNNLMPDALEKLRFLAEGHGHATVKALLEREAARLRKAGLSPLPAEKK